MLVLDETDLESNEIKQLVSAGAEIKIINSMNNLTDEERKNGDNYLSFMKKFIEIIKTEVY